MANVNYLLFGEPFCESQGAMMARVFETVLSLHPETLEEAVRSFSCLSKTDYLGIPDDLRNAPAAFLNQKRISVGGQQLYLGTSFSFAQKKKLISSLFQLCEEDESQLQLLEETDVKLSRQKGTRASAPLVYYLLLGRAHRSTQAQMLYRAMEELLNRKPEMLDWALKHLNCLAVPEDKDALKLSAFRQRRLVFVQNRVICVGSGYTLKAKLNFIDQLLTHGAFSPESFRVFNQLYLAPWQETAIRAVEWRLRNDPRDRRVGLLCQPAGTGQSIIISELSRRWLTGDSRRAVLLLSSTAELGFQLHQQMTELLGDVYPTELADSRQKLKETVGLPGKILVATAQKLLLSGEERNRDPEPCCSSEQLLVIVEEAAYHYFGQNSEDMHRYLPNAYYLGLTIDPEPVPALRNIFGPVLHQYSLAQAIRDRVLDQIRIEYVDSAVSHETGNAFYSEHRLRALAEWIAEQEKKQERCALLLCSSLDEADQMVFFLEDLLGTDRVRIHFAENVYHYQKRRTYRRDAAWDGRYFHGIVVACARIPSQPMDAVYLDQPVNRYKLMRILALLTRKSAHRREPGILFDLRNGQTRMEHILPEGLMPYNSEEAHPTTGSSVPILQEKLSNALKGRNFEEVEVLLEQICQQDAAFAEKLSSQLAFLFPQDMDSQARKQYWQQHGETLSWQADLWSLLSEDSAFCWQQPAPVQEDPPEEGLSEPLAADPDASSSQQRGAQLELAVVQLICGLFPACGPEVLTHLHHQGSGIQFGFDITFTYCDSHGISCTCMIECKNYTDNSIRMRDVAEKLVSLQQTGREVDHWILISPNGQLSNELEGVQKAWQEPGYWEPIGKVQFWTKSEQVHELFGLFPPLYREFYAVGEDDPSTWPDDIRSNILRRWKNRVQPVLRLPKPWQRYLQQSRCLLTSRESDRTTRQDYEALYPIRAPMYLLDDGERRIGEPAERYFLRWLRTSEKSTALLLGDFGDGKTYFTYTLARQLVEDFLQSPKAGWIPLRLSLCELGDQSFHFREILNRRLREFDCDINSWNEINLQYRFLIILDGFDEMSQGMHDTAVLGNLRKLEKLMNQFRGHRILITSRKHVIYSDRIKAQVLEILEQPEVLHLAPVTPQNRFAFLDRLADTQPRRARLNRIRNTHDLMGLAAKPLFLDMLRLQLDQEDIQISDVSEIYGSYARQVLERKHAHLELSEDYTSPKQIQNTLLFLLEELALYMLEQGKDSISLPAFQKYIQQDNLAQILWNSANTNQEETEEDAQERISTRSLLKRDSTQQDNRCFCHRSMKEYFTACAMVRILRDAPAKARTLLMDCSLGYEILDFGGKLIQKQAPDVQSLLWDRLSAFAHESDCRYDHPEKERYAALSTNAVNLLYYSGAGLPGRDWSNLLLDHIVLSGLDISGKDLSHSSLRYAHLDNTDLTGCDLRGCDFTGVQLEKSGQLVCFDVEHQDGVLLAYYKDGKIRNWEPISGKTEVKGVIPQLCCKQLLLRGNGREGLSAMDRLTFWQRMAGKLQLAGHIDLQSDISVIDFLEDVVLVQQNGTLCLLSLREGTVCLQKNVAPGFCACLLSADRIALWQPDGMLEIIVADRGEAPICTSESRYSVRNLCSAQVSGEEYLLAIHNAQNEVQLLRVIAGVQEKSWSIEPACQRIPCTKPITGISVDPGGNIYLGMTTGEIIHYGLDGRMIPGEKQRLHLELKCHGACIEGVRPQEQYEILKKSMDVS